MLGVEIQMIEMLPVPEGSSTSSIVQAFQHDLLDVTTETKLLLMKDLFLIAVKQGIYDSRARLVLLQIAMHLQVANFPNVEHDIAKWIAESSANDSDKNSTNGDSTGSTALGDSSSVAAARAKRERNRRVAYVGAAALGGGLVIGTLIA